MSGDGGECTQCSCESVVLMCMVGSAPSAQAAIPCGTVVNNLAACLGYLKSGGPVPAQCCSEVKILYNAVNTTPDRQQACNCMKSTAATVPFITITHRIIPKH